MTDNREPAPGKQTGKHGEGDKAKRTLSAGLVIQLCSSLRRELHLYPKGHSIPAKTTDRLIKTVEQTLGRKKRLSFEIFDNVVVFEGEPLVSESIKLASFVEDCRRHRLSNFAFLPGVSENDVELFAWTLGQKPEDLEGGKTLAEILEERSARGVAINYASSIRQKQGGATDKYGFQKSIVSYDSAQEAMGAVDEQLLSKSSLDVEAAKTIVENLLTEILRDDQAMISLTALKNHDETTSVHAVNTCILAMIIGQQLAFSAETMASLGLSALLHDIGKVRVPGQILGKRGRLDNKEWALIRRHPLEGARILQVLTGAERIAMVVAYEHHAGFDLSGYPRIKNKLRPHVFSRITQVADCFEAMTSSSRAYARSVYTPDEALNEMLKRPGFFDPVLMRLFVSKMGLYPVGTPVVLSTGDVAVVVKPGSGPANPVVKVFMDNEGREIQPFQVDLGDKNAATIRRTLPPHELEVDMRELVNARS